MDIAKILLSELLETHIDGEFSSAALDARRRAVAYVKGEHVPPRSVPLAKFISELTSDYPCSKLLLESQPRKGSGDADIDAWLAANKRRNELEAAIDSSQEELLANNKILEGCARGIGDKYPPSGAYDANFLLTTDGLNPVILEIRFGSGRYSIRERPVTTLKEPA